MQNSVQDVGHSHHLGFPIRMILANFDLQFAKKFPVNRPFSSGEEMQNRFSRWWPRPPSWIFDQNYFSYF